MSEINIKVTRDKNEVKYVSIIKRAANKSIAEIKEKLCDNTYVLSCDSTDIDGMIKMNEVIGLLQGAGAKVIVYENDMEVGKKFLENLIESHFDTEKFLDEMDEHLWA